jgi:hypothetical protein
LRDYELEETGRDANWQHHFRFKSFKRVEAFAKGTHQERLQWVRLFQADVVAYKQNKEQWEKTGLPPYMATEPLDAFTHCEERLDAAFFRKNNPYARSQAKAAAPTQPSLPEEVKKAYQVLNLEPPQPWRAIKKKFRQLTLKTHPDCPGGSEAQMRALLSAYACLEQHYNQ